MPLIDLPLEQLYTYRGRSPEPDDFSRFWTEALAELDHHEAAPVRRQADFQTNQASCWHLTFTGIGGADVHVKELRPRGWTEGDPSPAVIMFHGYGRSSGGWLEKAAWAAEGWSVFAMDVRGQGGASTDPGGVSGWTLQGHITRGLEDGPEQLFYRNVFLDAALLARLVCSDDTVDSSRVSTTGWSQGGALALVCAALEPRISRCAPVYPFLSDYRRVWEMDLAEASYQDIRRWFRRFDPRHEREESFFHTLGYIDIQHMMPWVRANVLMGTGLMDTECPPSTQFAAYNRLTSPKEVLVYPDFAHENLPGHPEAIFSFLTKGP
ncbi:alpha/beta fold hydrolase [Alkalicoccus chagannorensis]|uniref:alpha/beta fold hydrolase n=1 Tax=Alkalicoccus chagannorensis TaxID=427072 RepID=UPI0003FE6BAC|nr:alpha/beta fold hydrolase [Alkalicoccus chagannorensis]